MTAIADELNRKTERPPRITGVVFVAPVQFAGVQDSIQIGRNADSITPCKIDADGSASPLKEGQRSDGMLIRFRKTQCFVPWANLRELQYGSLP